MLEKKRRERGATLEAEQRDFIDAKLREEGLSIKAGAAKYQIAERTLRNALNGTKQDYATLEEIIDRLNVPDVKRLMERRLRLFYIPRERNAYFTGRDEKLAFLSQAMERSEFAAVTQALYGLGGMGKTSTAIEYAYRCLDKANFTDYPRYRAIQFVRADTVEVLKNGYVDIANRLQLRRADSNNQDQAVQAVLSWMMRPEEGPWLLILDNVDHPNILQGFLPKEPYRHYGHVLLTSRTNQFADRIKSIGIEAMDLREGVTFLYRRTERERVAESKEEQASERLVIEMGGLPLALEQTAAYMRHGQRMSFEDCLTNFGDQKTRAIQMMHAPEYGFYHRLQTQTQEYAEALTVLTTWQMSLESIKAQCPDAVLLMQFCSFLHSVGIPRELIFALLPDYFAPAAEDIVKRNTLYNDLLNMLAEHSLVQRDLNNDTHSVHILVQTVLQDGLQADDRRQVYKRVIHAVAHSFLINDEVVPSDKGILYYRHAERLRAEWEQTDVDGETAGILLNYMGVFLKSRGRFEEAEFLIKQGLAIRQKALPSDHIHIAASFSSLAELYRAQCCFVEAEPLYLQALAMWQKILPDDSIGISVCLNNLAILRCSQGRYTEAEPLLLQALALRQEGLPKAHTQIAQILNNLAVVYGNSGRTSEAEPLLLEALAIRQEGLPNGHPEIAQALNNLALHYRKQSRFAEAESLYLRALAIWQKALPEDHPDIAVCLTNLGVLYRRQERLMEAERYLREVLAMWEEAFPEGHPEIGTCLNNLAMIHDSQDRFAEAEPLYLQGLAMWRKTLPADHPDIAASLNHLAGAYQKHGRLAEAELLRKEAAEILQSELDTKHTV